MMIMSTIFILIFSILEILINITLLFITIFIYELYLIINKKILLLFIINYMHVLI